MSSSHPEAHYAVEGPDGFLCFTEGRGIVWREKIHAWRFLTRERAYMVLYELGLVNGDQYRITNLTDQSASQ